MQPRDQRPAVRLTDADTTTFERVTPPAAQRVTTAPRVREASPKLARMLLPGEHVTFGSSPHPIVFAAPIALAIAIGLALAFAQHGVTGVWRTVALGAAIAAWAGSFAMLLARSARYAGLRVVSTNRRIFAIRGVVIRRITPLGNTALAGSTVSQGVLGRIFGYGSIHLPLAEGTPDVFRDMRDVLQLYREFQAVANGVDGDDWKPAVRQTIIP